MSDKNTNELALTAQYQQVVLVHEHERSQLYESLNMIRSQAAGLCAVAELAIERGLVDDDLHHIANLSIQIKNHLTDVTHTIAELSNANLTTKAINSKATD